MYNIPHWKPMSRAYIRQIPHNTTHPFVFIVKKEPTLLIHKRAILRYFLFLCKFSTIFRVSSGSRYARSFYFILQEVAKFKVDGTLRRRKEMGHYCRRRHDITDNYLFFMSDFQQCFICRPSASTVSEDAGMEPRTVASTALAVRRSNHSARSQMRKVKRHYYILVGFVRACAPVRCAHPSFWLH
jgi:hypothetical protein